MTKTLQDLVPAQSYCAVEFGPYVTGVGRCRRAGLRWRSRGWRRGDDGGCGSCHCTERRRQCFVTFVLGVERCRFEAWVDHGCRAQLQVFKYVPKLLVDETHQNASQHVQTARCIINNAEYCRLRSHARARGFDNLCRGKVTVDIAMLLRMPASEAIVICSFYLLYGGWYD